MFIELLHAQTAVSSNTFDTSNYEYITLAADTLTTDTITIVMALPGGGTAPVVDVNGNAVAAFSSSVKSARLFGGPAYTVTKVGTTDTAGLYMAPAGRSA